MKLLKEIEQHKDIGYTDKEKERYIEFDGANILSVNQDFSI